MSKAYSNKALPAGTILREWRLEDVLGVGGFGIVYRGRGIYFGELVAIKEYFPSSISERDAEDTVVPIDSDAEEVHALGLKKFVEEAKLLWNLSTPTRHPNIVSVRSLFEIHGTAYMVMDFEDGVSLSKLLKQGRRFNERSLWSIIRPIAEGLDRAHRVGVLHRDIKPPNILITEDSRPVLIDFGSARFEAAEATSTKVTFHTPPYAAIEQYVKTYDQGPWTDIYALGVVLYECVTGEKPPEVLERLHGGMGKPLAEGHWPGFGKRFLEAIDAAMTIRPAERPQSIRDWLAMFGKKDLETAASPEEEPTRFFAHEVATEEIVPVPPPAPGFDRKEPLETGVPGDPSEVQFKRAGEETGASKRKKKSEKPGTKKPAEVDKDEEPGATEEPEAVGPKPKRAGAKGPAKERAEMPRAALVAVGGAVVLLAAIAGGAIMYGGGDSPGTEAESTPSPKPSGSTSTVAASDVGALASAARLLAEDARTAGAPESAVNGLLAASEQLDSQSEALQPLLKDPAQAAAAAARADEMRRIAAAANVEFANALLRNAESRARAVPAAATAEQRTIATRVRNGLSDLRSSVEALAGVTDPVQSLGGARDALAKSQSVIDLAAYGREVAQNRAGAALPPPPAKSAAVARPTAPSRTATTAVKETPTASDASGVSPAKMQQFNGIIDDGRGMARRVIRMGGRSSSDTRKANAVLARNYDSYLKNLKDSMRGARSDREADRLIKQASQTRAYLQFLVKQSSESR